MVWQAFFNKQHRSTHSYTGVTPEEWAQLVRVVQAAGEQQRIKKGETPKREEERSAASSVRERGESLKEDVDKLLDEIDEVLEENAEEFVKNYVQRGGE